MAVLPSLHDPRLNTVECVITGHDKAPNFGGLKQLLHGVSWSILSVSLVMHMFASQSLILQLRKWSEENCQSKIAAVMVLTVFVLIGGIALSSYALHVTNKYELYTSVFLGGVVIVFLRRCVWCIYKQYPNRPEFDLTSGHDKPTSKNFFSWVALYPAVFMACHHVLWIFLGIVTEPFWGITVLVAVLCASFALYFLSYQFHRAVTLKPKVCFNTVMIFILIITGFCGFVLLIMVLIIVSQVFLSDSLISTLVQNGAVVVATYWFRHYSVKDEKGEGGKLYRVCCLSHDVGEERQGDGGNVNRVRCLLHVDRAGREGDGGEGGREEGGVEGRVNDEEGGGGGGGEGEGGVQVLEEVELKLLPPRS